MMADDAIKFIEYEVPPGHRTVRIPFVYHESIMSGKIPIDMRDFTQSMLSKVVQTRDAEIRNLLDNLKSLHNEMKPLLRESQLAQRLIMEFQKYFADNKYAMSLINDIVKSERIKIAEQH